MTKRYNVSVTINEIDTKTGDELSDFGDHSTLDFEIETCGSPTRTLMDVLVAGSSDDVKIGGFCT